MPAAKKTAPSTSTAVAKRATNVVSIRDQLRQQAEDQNSKIAPPSGISIQALNTKEFKFPDGTKAPEFEAVIVDFTSMNAFYPGPYDPKNISPPACFAIGSNPLQLVPSNNSPAKESDECKGCPNNEFGSAGDGKACKNMRVLAVLPPDADDNTPMWTIKLSPTAIKAFDSYVRGVATTFQLPPVGVVTKFSFDPTSDYATVRVSEPQPLNDEQLAVFAARQDEAAKLLATEPDVSQFQNPTRAPAKKVANARGARR
jgi:hypothetical protein